MRYAAWLERERGRGWDVVGRDPGRAAEEDRDFIVSVADVSLPRSDAGDDVLWQDRPKQLRFGLVLECGLCREVHRDARDELLRPHRLRKGRRDT